MKIVGIATQGRQDAAQWVTAYYIYYGYDGVYFSKVRYWWNYAVKVSKIYLRLMLREPVVIKCVAVKRRD